MFKASGTRRPKAGSTKMDAGDSRRGTARLHAWRVHRTDHVRADASRPFPWWAYVVAFLVVDAVAVCMMQWSVLTVSPIAGMWGFFAKMFTEGELQFLLNMLSLGMVQLALLFAINRFWVSTPVFIGIVGFCAVVERLKVGARYETVKPSDFAFLQGGNAGNIAGFMPANGPTTIAYMVTFVLACVVVCAIIRRRDGRTSLIVSPSPASPAKVVAVADGEDDGEAIDMRASLRYVGPLTRILLLCATLGLLASFSSSLGTVGSWGSRLATSLSDSPKLWDSVWDAQANGTMVGFQRFVNPKVMDEPDGYSEERMQEIAAKYADEADAINKDRGSDLLDNTVIMVLSESFSDPLRVPNLALSKDPIPNIRSIKHSTTSGLMLSSGYGGGTANLEYQALTGMSMANFDASLTSPYQQLISKRSWNPTFNQLWNVSSTTGGSLAVHPYDASMYSRADNYRRFGFSHFYTLTGQEKVTHQEAIDYSPYVSDKSTYQSVYEQINQKIWTTQFLQVVTMQNHMSYDNWYVDNDYRASVKSGMPLGLDEQQQIQTYAKGLEYTDRATREFLNKLDRVDKPITVIFYGDHLPGIYATAAQDAANSVALHETDYFIWSNAASKSKNTKLKDKDAAYTSPNFLMAEAAEHTDSRVSPFLAFLTLMHGKIAAMEPPVVNEIQEWSRIPEGQALYLDAKGNPINLEEADDETRELVEDYQLIQYDITAGKGYLRDAGFMDLPEQQF